MAVSPEKVVASAEKSLDRAIAHFDSHGIQVDFRPSIGFIPENSIVNPNIVAMVKGEFVAATTKEKVALILKTMKGLDPDKAAKVSDSALTKTFELFGGIHEK